MSEEETMMDRVGAIMSNLTTMTLATAGPGGEPHAAAVYFAADRDGTLYFLSAKTTVHAEHLLRDPRVAATIHDENQQWESLRGIQLRGTAAPVAAARMPRAAAVYAAKFAFAAIKGGAGGALADALSKTTFWGLKPEWIRLIDNSRGFGFKEEISFPPDGGGMAKRAAE
ncbi:MAG: hypothetical protein Fur0032_20720 [Terrimicrobiaceae bacterium]